MFPIIRVEHDDDAVTIVEKINEALEDYARARGRTFKMQLIDDDQPHDGFVMLMLKEVVIE